ncbi:MAG: hypothetical protein BRD55_09790 [Bacteroidetes bacterium SW_9_63_38]|nr:MAG: hypothetical protein BRD55_09790 [Bacteroidetes bacterium SW_9_63_38]
MFVRVGGERRKARGDGREAMGERRRMRIGIENRGRTRKGKRREGKGERGKARGEAGRLPDG